MCGPKIDKYFPKNVQQLVNIKHKPLEAKKISGVVTTGNVDVSKI